MELQNDPKSFFDFISSLILPKIDTHVRAGFPRAGSQSIYGAERPSYYRIRIRGYTPTRAAVHAARLFYILFTTSP